MASTTTNLMNSDFRHSSTGTPTPPEPFVSLNALLFFILSIGGISFIISSGIGQIYTDAGRLLPFALFCLIAPLIYLSIGQRSTGQTDRRRFVWVITSCSILIVGMFIRQLIIRPWTDTQKGIYDGAIQSEVAADFFLHGINPYGADYRGTPYAAVNKPVIGNNTDNEVWYHYIYPPLNFLVYLPLRILSPILGPLADYRLVTIGALYVLTWLLTRQAQTWSQKTTVVLLTLGNVLLWGYAVIGCNDLLVVLLIVGSTILLRRQRWWWGGALFGLALASKQVAWVLLPLWLYWIWQVTRHTLPGWKNFRRTLSGTIIMVAIFFGPFILWNPLAIFTDLVRYAGGAIPETYPIAGTTLLQYFYILGIIPSPFTVVPVYLFQLMVSIPISVLTAGWVRLAPQASRWLAGAAVLILSVMLVSRFFNNNFLQIPMVFLIAAYLLQSQELEAIPDRHPR